MSRLLCRYMHKPDIDSQVAVNINLTMFSFQLFSCSIDHETSMETLNLKLLLVNHFRLLVLVFATSITLFYFTKLFHILVNNHSNVAEKAKEFPLPPGPKPWPLIGCLPQMLMNKPAPRWIHEIMEEMNTEIACFRLGKVHVISVTCPKLGLEFLRKQDAVFSSRPLTMSSDVTSGGYLTTALTPFGPQWKKMRRFMAKEVLCPARHKWLSPKRTEEADHLVHYVYNQCKNNLDETGGLVNIRAAARHYSGNLIRKIVFSKRFFGKGRKDGGPGTEEKEHVDALRTILEHLFNFCISDFFPFLVGLDLDGQEKAVKKASRIISKYHDPIIKERINHWKDGTKKEVEDLLDVLITSKDDNGNNLVYQEIKAQITEIMVAALDNPSNALEWALAEMLTHPHILDKAMQELDRVVGKERLVQESDFSQLNYVKACAKEAFRLHPLKAFSVPHASVADTTVSGYFIPKGSHVFLSRKGFGRNPKVWEDPLMFKPERHLKVDKEVTLTDTDLNLISFSTGRRGCTGIALGTSMTMMLFARLLHCFTWSAPIDQDLSIDLSEFQYNADLTEPLVAVGKPRLPGNLYLFE